MGRRPIETTLVTAGVRSRRLARVPATPRLRDLAVLGEAGHDPVEVVLLDPHRLGELGDGDPGAGLDELERLVGAGAAAARAPAAAGARALGAARARAARCRGGCRAATVAVAADAGQRLFRRLQAVELVHEWAQLFETLRDLLALFLKEVRHSTILP